LIRSDFHYIGKLTGILKLNYIKKGLAGCGQIIRDVLRVESPLFILSRLFLLDVIPVVKLRPFFLRCDRKRVAEGVAISDFWAAAQKLRGAGELVKAEVDFFE
jgi:hypothetical protein